MAVINLPLSFSTDSSVAATCCTSIQWGRGDPMWRSMSSTAPYSTQLSSMAYLISWERFECDATANIKIKLWKRDSVFVYRVKCIGEHKHCIRISIYTRITILISFFPISMMNETVSSKRYTKNSEERIVRRFSLLYFLSFAFAKPQLRSFEPTKYHRIERLRRWNANRIRNVALENNLTQKIPDEKYVHMI